MPQDDDPHDEFLQAMFLVMENTPSEAVAGEHLDDESLALLVSGQLVSGQLEDELGSQVIAHLNQCVACRRAVTSQIHYHAAPDAIADLLARAGTQDPETLTQRAGMLLSTGRVTQAIHEFRTATELAPQQSRAWFGLAQAYQAAGDYASAEVALEKCLTLQPEHPAARARLAIVLEELSRPDEALQIWQQLAETTTIIDEHRRQAQAAVKRLRKD